MSRKKIACICAGLTGIVFLASSLVWTSSQVPPEAVALRERYPYVSLQDRLAFEAARSEGDSSIGPMLSEPAKKRLDNMEMVFDSPDSRARLLSLQKLHSREVASFISRPGNGLSRMGRLPTPDLLEYAEPAAVSIADTSDDSGTGQQESMDSQAFSRDEQAASAPTADELQQFHLAGQIAFADPWSFGDVRNRDQVAGFVPHGFPYMPKVGDPRNQYLHAYDPPEEQAVNYTSPWKIARLELVSLLKFEEPAVYVTGQLPRMADLAGARTRRLTPFEKRGLESLRAGEDLITDVGPNHIHMLGSLRAVKQCLNCHSGQRGDLLGAFSYQLRRDPPLPGDRPAT